MLDSNATHVDDNSTFVAEICILKKKSKLFKAGYRTGDKLQIKKEVDTQDRTVRFIAVSSGVVVKEGDGSYWGVLEYMTFDRWVVSFIDYPYSASQFNPVEVEKEKWSHMVAKTRKEKTKEENKLSLIFASWCVMIGIVVLLH